MRTKRSSRSSPIAIAGSRATRSGRSGRRSRPSPPRYGDDDAHLWLAGIPAPIYGPSGGSYGVDYSDIDEMELCSRVLALTAESICS